ncbi:conserved hypothetical protein [Parafrankia sp. EAN1pec]|uniref:AAA family ATPase n=1 Tax=Parafrankia sp. (strain EAN1pec) TaxID=298653 RepID=UPI00015D9DF6|nr:conserved hypothetical protein [Frankia sp. EAN1pec]
MRVRALSLDRYGAFEDRRIEFGRGLTVVVGANEAGKSTTLDALSDLLWTFRGTRRSFQFSQGALSLTADLELPATHPAELPPPSQETGPARQAPPARVEVRRRNSGLQTVDDGAVFLPPWGSGGADARRRWRQAFGLSHAELRAGGASVFEGTGDLAELVFTARSGRAVRGLLDTLAAEMDSLYKSHRNNKSVRVRTALADYERLAEQAASAMTRAAHVDDARREQALRRRDAQAAAAATRAAADRRSRLERWVRAAPHARELVVLRERHAALLAAGVALTAEETALFDSSVREAATAEADLDRLTADLLDRRAAREALTTDESVLADGEMITRLEQSRVARLGDGADARALENEAARHADSARALLLDLAGPGDPRTAAELLADLHVPRDLAAQLDALAVTVGELTDELRRAEDALAAARLRRDGTDQSPGHDPASISQLKAVIGAIAGEGSATALTRAAVDEAARAVRDRREALHRAGARDPDGPPPGMPGRDEIRLARDRLDAAEVALARREEELVGATRNLELAQSRVADADGRDLPDQATLDRARATREELWNLLVDAAGGLPPTTGGRTPAPAVGGVPPVGGRLTPERARELLPVIAAGIARADEVADQLIRHADLAARRAQLHRDADLAHERATAALAATAAAAEAADQARAAWEGHWHKPGLAVPSRADADDVQRAVDEAHRAHAELLAAETRIARLGAQADAQRTALAQALAEVGLARVDADLDSLLTCAQTVLADDDLAQVRRADAAHFGRAVEEAERERDKRREELLGAEGDWDNLVRAAGLASVTDPRGWTERRGVLAQAVALHEQADRAARDAERAAGRHQAFAADIRELSARHGLLHRSRGQRPDTDASAGAGSGAEGGAGSETGTGGERLAAGPVAPDGPGDEADELADLLDQLSARHQASIESRTRRAEIDQAVATLGTRVTAATLLRDSAVGRLDELRAQVVLAPGQQLTDAADRGRDLAGITAAMTAAEGLLRAAAPGDELEAVVRALAASTDEDLAADLADARDEHERRTAAQTEAWTAVGTVERHLRDLESGAATGELHARAQESLALVAETAERYVIARIQYETLGRELESYERRHASPLLADAGRLLERLTEGRYVALRAIDRGDGARTLRVVRADEDELGPGELSEGTADQVFLALRLAAIDQLQRERTSRGEPTLPVVLDDVLMTFDDTRAEAALRVLAEIAGRWQIILLTHHEHLTDLARVVDAQLRADGPGQADGALTPPGDAELVTISYLPGANVLTPTRDAEQIRTLATHVVPPDPGAGEPGGSPALAVTAASGGGNGSAAAGRDAGRIRAWARQNGFEVGDRGRIPREILDAFADAHSA